MNCHGYPRSHIFDIPTVTNPYKYELYNTIHDESSDNLAIDINWHQLTSIDHWIDRCIWIALFSDIVTKGSIRIKNMHVSYSGRENWQLLALFTRAKQVAMEITTAKIGKIIRKHQLVNLICNFHSYVQETIGTVQSIMIDVLVLLKNL